LFVTSAWADTLERVKQQGFFVWGADEEGGGPYVYPDPAAPGQRTGFEVELAALLASELGTELGRSVEGRFSQGPWEKLPDLLGTGRIDMVLNGYEWSPERAQLMASTAPYYIYELQLLARSGDDGLKSWEELAARSRPKVGVLGGSAAERYLLQRFPRGEAEIVNYDGNTNAMGDVVSGRIVATLQDFPIAVFYRKEFPSLRFVGEPLAPGRYVIYLRRNDLPLRDALDRAIHRLREGGALRKLYERYSIWTSAQESPELLKLPDATPLSPETGILAFFHRHGLTLLEAAGMTVFLSVTSFPLAILLGLLIALGRRYGPRILSLFLTAYVEVLRGTPFMLQLFVLFYLLPNMGILLAPLLAAILGLAINYSAYEAEIYRAGLQAVPDSQMEAALALGMSRGLALRRIIVPQAARIVIPPVTNDFIALFKDTSVCSVITVVELTKRYNISAMNHPSEILPLAALTAFLYLAMSYPLSLFAAYMERRLQA
jgi:polar amino acid transport system substrate-binding protein